jgi:hypothetical protein
MKDTLRPIPLVYHFRSELLDDDDGSFVTLAPICPRTQHVMKKKKNEK